MDDDKSTPISSLNNRDDTEVVSQILNKYNNLQDGQTSIPPINSNIPVMENDFDKRNLNQEIYNINSDNVQYNDHYQTELKRTQQQNNPYNQYDEPDDDDEDDEYDEYEVVQAPLWKKVMNELRIPIYIFIFILIFFNCTFDKVLLKYIPKLGNPFNECNTYGFLLKALLISLLSYILIKYVYV
jgi:hypothetical protein